MTNTLIKALQQSGIFPDPVVGFEVIETHISWVVLTGAFAYKIKKPVNLGFVDFTTLEKRKLYCEKEVALNQRLAPDLYLGIFPIMGSEGEVIDYAIKMHQFPQTNILKYNALSLEIVEDLALQIASFHQKAEKCPDQFPYGNPDDILLPMQDNFIALRNLLTDQPVLECIHSIEQASLQEYKKLIPLMRERKQQGWIRACHGDLHLGNIVLMNQKPLIFDCIEFNERFRWLDVMSDIAFLMMDLKHLSHASLSYYFLNRYCELTNDYSGLALLRFYQCYRAVVRAKVSAFQLQMDLSAAQKQSLQTDLDAFLTLAKHYMKPSSPSLTITFGVSGSGKTYQSQVLLMKTGAIRLRSDIFRVQLEKDRYSENATQAIYNALALQAENLLKSDHSVIIDATCLKQWQRKLFLDLAMRLQIPFDILALDASIEVLHERIQSRQDISEATSDVLTLQLKEREPLTEFEKQYVINDQDLNL